MPSVKCLLIVCFVAGITHGEKDFYEFRMPGIQTTTDDAYVCRQKHLEKEPWYITAFEPIYNEEVAHHMIIFACEKPGSNSDTWDCDHHSEDVHVCKGKGKIIFSWAMNAPDFHLPNDTSFMIGGDTLKYLVMQIHYKDAAYFRKNPTALDTSGMKFTVQTTPTKRLAGVYIFVTDGVIQPEGSTTLVAACQYTGSTILYPFAFRVHAHSHGVLNRAFVIHEGDDQLIGSKSPQEPQTFYPVQNTSLQIHDGDIMVASCLMNNNEKRLIRIGNTRQDEMCNFYMMYSVELNNKDQLSDPDNQYCLTNGNVPLEEQIDEIASQIIEPGDDVMEPEVDEKYEDEYLKYF